MNNTSNFKSDSYLYGYSLTGLANEPYTSVLVIKYKLANTLANDLIVNSFNDPYYDKSRLNAVLNARDFNREMLKELGYTDANIKDLIKSCDLDLELSKINEKSKPILNAIQDNFMESMHYIKENIVNIPKFFQRENSEKSNSKHN